MSLSHPRLLVVQPLPGIGDMVWHLPHIQALAHHVGGPVSLLAKPRSRADELFCAEDTVREIIWLDRHPKGARGAHDGILGLWRLIRGLRSRQFDAAVLLHSSLSLALATWAAGIPARQGYGIGAQRLFLNQGPYLEKPIWRRQAPMERATMFLQAANVVMKADEPHLAIASSARTAVQRRLSGVKRPLVVFGIGSSEPTRRQWGAQRFAALARALIDAGWQTLVLVGGPLEETLRSEISAVLADDTARVVSALAWTITETAALLAEASFYVGNNTGMAYMSAAVGTRTYVLFGTGPPLRYSKQIVPILSPPGGAANDVARVSPEAVLAVIERDRGALVPGENGGILRSASHH